MYNAPALQKGGQNDPQSTPSQYLAFEIDVEAGRFRAFQRVGSEWGKISHEKNISRTTPLPVLSAPAVVVPTRRRRLSAGVGRDAAAVVGKVWIRAEDSDHVLPDHVVV